MRLQLLDVGVYESFVDCECGDWKLVEIVLYCITDIDYMGFLVPFSTVGNGIREMEKWEMGGWMASVDSGLWGRNLLGNKGFGRERRVDIIQVGYSVTYRL